MRAIGVIRRVDGANRIVIPDEVCQIMDIKKNTPLELFVDGDSIIFKKYHPGCTFCGSMEDLKSFKDKNICGACLDDMPT